MPKLLRLICCETAPDGEKLAAVSRLSAIVAAHELDWDRALANGNAPALNEEQHRGSTGKARRGYAETEQRLRPHATGRPAVGRQPVGDDAERLEAILRARQPHGATPGKAC